jgi:PTH1 family peptidyl-tRNA hydrolase
VILGLGNPDKKYERTRHNLGFMTVDELARRLGAEFENKRLFLSSETRIDGKKALLIKPLTYMNRSGLVLKALLYDRGFFSPEESLVVVQDDIDMEEGRLRIRKGGASGGHRGIESIHAETGIKDFIRIKVGAGREPGLEPEKYVLKKIPKAGMPLIMESVRRAADAVECVIKEGLPAAMNRFNRKPA